MLSLVVDSPKVTTKVTPTVEEPEQQVKTSQKKIDDAEPKPKIERKESEFSRSQTFKQEKTITMHEKKTGVASNCFDCLKSAAYCGTQDDQVQKDANKLLYKMVWNHWFIILCCLLLGALGSIPELAAPFFIGQVVNAFETDKMSEVQTVISIWAVVIVVGAFLGMIREILTHYASELFGMELR